MAHLKSYRNRLITHPLRNYIYRYSGFLWIIISRKGNGGHFIWHRLCSLSLDAFFLYFVHKNTEIYPNINSSTWVIKNLLGHIWHTSYSNNNPFMKISRPLWATKWIYYRGWIFHQLETGIYWRRAKNLTLKPSVSS